MGRGLVVPYLHESGFNVITVDTDRTLALQLKKNQDYDISLTDTGETCHIPVNDVLHPDNDMLQHWLNKASLIYNLGTQGKLASCCSITPVGFT